MLDASEVRERIDKELVTLRKWRRWEWLRLVLILVLIAATQFHPTANMQENLTLLALIIAVFARTGLDGRDERLLELMAALSGKKASASPNSPDMGIQT